MKTQSTSSKPAAKSAPKAAPKASKAKAAPVLETPVAAKAAPISAMDFAVQQLSAPVAPVTTPAPVVSTLEQELAALYAKHGVDPAHFTKQRAARPDRTVQNGITRPGMETTCGKIWAAADELSNAMHGVATIASLKAHPATKAINEHTIKTQYARWRTFNGVHGRLPKISAVHEEPAEYAAPVAEVVAEVVTPEAAPF